MDNSFHYNFHTEPGYVVTFIDLLGFSSAISCKNTSEPCIGSLYDFRALYEDIVITYENVTPKEDDVGFLWVSDSIFLTAKIEHIDKLLSELTDILRRLFICNFACSGGIAIGDLYFDCNIWGTAVVNAVQLEKNERVPRIIVSEQDYQQLALYTKKRFSRFQSNDGKYYYQFMTFDTIIEKMLCLGQDATAVLSSLIEFINSNFHACTENYHKEKWKYLAKELKTTISRYAPQIDNSCIELFDTISAYGENPAEPASTIFLSRIDKNLEIGDLYGTSKI